MAMETAGFPVDLSQMNEVRADLESRIAEIEDEAWKIAGDQFPLSNLDAKRWVLFGEGVRKDRAGEPIPVYGANKVKLKSQDLRVRSRTEKTDVPQVTAARVGVLRRPRQPHGRVAQDVGRAGEAPRHVHRGHRPASSTRTPVGCRRSTPASSSTAR